MSFQERVSMPAQLWSSLLPIPSHPTATTVAYFGYRETVQDGNLSPWRTDPMTGHELRLFSSQSLLKRDIGIVLVIHAKRAPGPQA